MSPTTWARSGPSRVLTASRLSSVSSISRSSIKRHATGSASSIARCSALAMPSAAAHAAASRAREVSGMQVGGAPGAVARRAGYARRCRDYLIWARRLRRGEADGVVVEHQPAVLGRRAPWSRGRSRAGAAAPSMWGQSEPKITRSAPMSVDDRVEVVLPERVDPDVPAELVDRVLAEPARASSCPATGACGTGRGGTRRRSRPTRSGGSGTS